MQWTSDKKYWLCGPMITAASQVSRMFGHAPEVIKLGKSKFSLIRSGKFSLVSSPKVDGANGSHTSAYFLNYGDLLQYCYISLLRDNICKCKHNYAWCVTVCAMCMHPQLSFTI